MLHKTALQPLSSHLKKSSTWDKQDTAGEARMFFYGPLHMDVVVLADLQELI